MRNDSKTRARSAWRKLTLAALTALVFAGPGCSHHPEEVADRNTKKIDAQALATLVQSSREVEEIEHSWGWLKWLMNQKIDPDAEMTFGLVEINASQDNPLHEHPNSEEILYVLSGSCEHRIGDQTVTLEQGQMIRIPAGVPHMARNSGSEAMRAVIVYSSGDRQFVLVDPVRPSNSENE